MKTIVSLALAGLMSISALLPALAAQETENVSIPESSGISESMAQDESSVSSSGSTADESTEPESGSNAEDGSDSVPQSESADSGLFLSFSHMVPSLHPFLFFISACSKFFHFPSSLYFPDLRAFHMPFGHCASPAAAPISCGAF